MSAIRIRRTIDSDTIHLPELRPYIGHTVDILIEDQPAPFGVIPGTGNWDTFLDAAVALRETYDYDAITEKDARDMLQSPVLGLVERME